MLGRAFLVARGIALDQDGGYAESLCSRLHGVKEMHIVAIPKTNSPDTRNTRHRK